MSTRATYTFRDEDGLVHVYKHHDGYPSGAVQWIEAALAHAWLLPRFEANEFAAAFVAANKPKIKKEHRSFGGGGVRLIASDSPTGWQDFATDQEYHYEITSQGENLIVTAWKTSFDFDDKCHATEIFTGTLKQMKDKFRNSTD